MKVKTDLGYFELPDTKSNRKVMMIILRALKSNRIDVPLFTYQNIAEAFGYQDRRNVHNYYSEYESGGGDILALLTRKRKVDTAVVKAVGDVVEENPTASTSDRGRSMKWQPISSKRRHKGRKFRGAI